MRVFSALVCSLIIGATALLPGQVATPGQARTMTSGQQPSTPQRMPARPLRPGEAPPKGTAVLKGQVIAAGTGTPIRRAQVRAMSMEGRGGGVTSTDNEGNFEIRELAAGRYNVSASKGGFVMGQFGQRRPGDPGTPIDLGEGQRAEKVNFILSRGGVIAGKIVDDGGEPVAGTMVTAMRYQFIGGQRRLVQGGSEGGNDRTDDQGGFRLFGLPPGDYYVSANARNGMMSSADLNNTEADGFAPTYYPGTPNVGEATRIPLKAGQEMTGANFALIVARMARIRGRALNSRGEPVARGMMMLTPAEPSMGMMFMMNGNAMIGPDGSFQFTNVAPGRYNINVRPMGMPGATDEIALMPITVGNEDIDNVIVTTALGATAKGVIVTDDGSVPAFRPDQVQIFAQPADMTMNVMGGGPTRVNDDFTFELTSLFERRLLRASVATGGASGWYMKAVLLDGQDITDSGMEFTPGRAYEGLQVVFTRKATDLSGLVTDDRNRPVVDASVVIFPADRDKWTFQSRYIRTVRPDTNGRFTTKALPPLDDYLIIAVQNLESGQGSDPDFLARAREEARPLSLAEGETKAFDVKLSKLVP
ncbi:MAG TPA: carboxypeptidase-like regulatory domain-containing protein [Vicinamibacterales bacterium]|nr:carboxypeptidase-like regulatory domain-containing protein [Vicinamibacterales bacterium]